MIKAYDKIGVELGTFDGRFVFDRHGEKLYWVEGRDVFSVPNKNTDSHLDNSPCLGIGKFNGEIAKDDAGEIIFLTNIKLVHTSDIPESC